ncbi:MAG: TonB-dependent receptor [Chloroherpetonaceae bacterium]|nr:TonB-dependent receptor [Chloroherpetonaceae bacterium]
MNRFKTIAFGLLALATFAVLSSEIRAEGGETGILTGKVTSLSGEPIIGATIKILGTTLGATTNIRGEFRISKAPAGKISLRISALGYEPISDVFDLEGGATSTVTFTLSESNFSASEVVVSASKHEQNRLEIPITTTVISEQAINALPLSSLDQVLESIPGVDVTRSGGFGSSSVQIRGSNSMTGGGIGTRVMMLYDGFLMNTPDAGSVDWQNFMMNGIGRLEVVKGAASSLYGSGAMGGIINVIGTMPSEMTFNVRFSNGFYDAPPSFVNTRNYPNGKVPYFYNTMFTHGNTIGDLSYNVIYSRMSDEGYRQNSNQLMDDLKLKLTYQITPTQQLIFSGLINRNEGGQVYPWRSKANALSADANDYLSDDQKESGMEFAGLTHVMVFDQYTKLETRASYYRYHFVIKYYPQFSEAFGPFQQYTLRRRAPYDPNDPNTFNNSDAKRLSFGIQLNRLASDHQITTGIDAYIDDVQSTLYYNNKSYTIGAYIQDDFSLGERLRFSFGIRFDLNHLMNRTDVSYLDILNPFSTAQPDGSIYPTVVSQIEHPTLWQLSPRVAATYKLDDESALRASVSRSFRAPTLAERFITEAGIFAGIPNGTLDAERMTSFEFGVYKAFGNQFSIDFSTYANFYTNLIESQDISPAKPNKQVGDIIFQYKNFAEARILGFEFALTFRPINELTFQLGYNFMDARDLSPNKNDLLRAVTADSTNNWLPYRPQHNISGSANFTWNDLSMMYSARYLPQYRRIRLALSEADYPGDFLVMDLTAAYQVLSQFKVTATVQNFTNTQYEELEQFRMPGRSFHIGFEFNL